ncbi:reverse transcriptase [Plakobranchus ocellatus]|uniref:Reverse transcriptase n=1 Tax=Plakobranchus ocellatus TaxID=259542 RepID=A0AAV4DLV8_9GAST|nr:reverse transcriptase [Plakobranchus ocellatus]
MTYLPHRRVLCGLFLVCTLTLVRAQVSQRDAAVTFQSDWPVGDVRRCLDRARRDNLTVIPLEVLPGLGWDNLQNLEAGQVVVYNYSQCKLTNDGRLLIPDTVFTVPLKTSELETFAELIDHWHNTSSLTSDTINVQAGLSLPGMSISGKFSREHEQLKSKQIEDKAVTVRVQLRYTRYESKLQPDAQLSPQFKSRVLRIGAFVELNQTEQAGYEAQLIVRDFGTHVLTSLTAGAAIVKDDYLRREFVESHSEDKTAILASASASFFGVFSAGASYSHKTDNKVDDMYNKSMTHSYIKSLGGSIILAEKMTLNQWSEGVDLNLVAMDRAGDPLYFLITPQAFPELPGSTVAEVEKQIRHAIEIYYQMNIIPGCTKLGSPKFSVSANFDDGSCTARPTNNTFGGVYQTCTVSGEYLSYNPCTGLDQVNPKTGSHSCPAAYTAVRVHQGSKRGHAESVRRCHSCGLFGLFHCCHTDQYQATANYQTFWCAATGPVPPESGYRFGGVFTSTSINLVTGDKGCPPGFYARKMFTDMSVCISDDFELDTAFSVQFGGFFSCDMGNPLASAGVHPVGSNGGDGKLKAPAPNSLQSFMARTSGPESWPSRCPDGYSQHLATQDMGCAIHYCVESGALSGPYLPPVKRPPFMQKPDTELDHKDNLVMFDMDTQMWMKNEKAREFLKHMKQEPGFKSSLGEENDGSSGISAGAASGISIACTLALVGLSTLAVFTYRRRQTLAARFRRTSPYRSLSAEEETTESLNPHAGDYGAVSSLPQSTVPASEDQPQIVVR